MADLNVLVASRSASVQGLGGPVWRIRALLREQARHPIPGLHLAGVFCDGIVSNGADLRPLPVSHPNGRASVLPPSVSYVGQAASSVPRLVRNFGRAARSLAGPVVLDCHDFVSAYVARRRFGRTHPLLLNVHAKGGGVREVLLDHPRLGGTPIAALARHIEDSAVRWADAVVFPSGGARDAFADAHPGLLDGKETRTIHAGLGVEELRATPHAPDLAAKYGVREGQRLIVSVAAMVHDKGLDTLVEALAALPADLTSRTACLVVAREGPLKARLEEAIVRHSLQDRMRLLGFIPREDLVGLLRAADLFVLPSRVAIFDVVLLEAAALGTPVITSAIGGNLEMFDAETAVLLPPDEPALTARAITEALTNPDRTRLMAEAAARRVETVFSLGGMLRAHAALYREFAELREPGPAKGR